MGYFHPTLVINIEKTKLCNPRQSWFVEDVVF